MIARVVGYRLVEGNSHPPQYGDRGASLWTDARLRQRIP